MVEQGRKSTGVSLRCERLNLKQRVAQQQQQATQLFADNDDAALGRIVSRMLVPLLLVVADEQ